MRNVNCSVLSLPDSATATGSQIDSSQLVAASFQAVFGDNLAAGTFKLQISNDINNDRYQAYDFTATHWVDLPNQSTAISGGGSKILTVSNMTYRWIRAVFTPTDPSVKSSAVIQDLTYTARSFGPSGDSISLTYVDPGAPDAVLSVSVVGSDITVSLATDSGSAITTTADDITAAIAGSVLANALVTVAVSGTGSNVQTAQSQTFLSGSSGGYTTVSVNMNALSM